MEMTTELLVKQQQQEMDGCGTALISNQKLATGDGEQKKSAALPPAPLNLKKVAAEAARRNSLAAEMSKAAALPPTPTGRRPSFADQMRRPSCSSPAMKESSDLRNDLMRLMIGDDLLKIKAQYLDERTALNLRRPVNFGELEHYFQNKYGRLLNFYYTTSTRELMIQFKNQQELDQVIQLHEGSGGAKHRMRIILSQKRDQQPSSPSSSHPVPLPPMGIHQSGIAEAALSDSSSLWSLLSVSTSGGSSRSAPGSANRLTMGRWAEEGGGETPPQTPRPPANWREGRCLGRGAFGQVFVCLNVDTGEQLVVKKIHLGRATAAHQSRQRNNRVLAALENELNLLGTLRHPHIVQYFGVAQKHDCVNIFMELMAGGSLKDQISEYGALGEAVSVRFGAQILCGLAYLHARDIVHRDIKPANILRHTHAHVKIGDFGAAKFLQAICSEQGVDIEGTPHYTAPEIVRADGRRFEPRSDIWSVGITLVEMLTTVTPWAGIDPAAVHVKIAFSRPSLASLPASISGQLRSAIEAMLCADVEHRPHAAQLLAAPPFEAVTKTVSPREKGGNTSVLPSAGESRELESSERNA